MAKGINIKGMALVMLLFAILLLSGCEQGQTNTMDTSASFIGGNDGLKFSFAESVPTDEVMEKVGFGIALQVNNAGEAEIPIGKIKFTISGIVADDFTKIDSDLSKINTIAYTPNKKTLDGQIIPGTEDYFSFGDFNYKHDLQGNMQFTLNAEACYDYYTNVVTKICVRKDLLKSAANPGTGCEVKGEKIVQNSGAPVQITSLSQTPAGPNSIRITFNIEKIGTGEIVTECGTTDYNKLNKVDVTIDTGLPNLVCDALTLDAYGKGTVQLFGGKRTVTCTQTIDNLMDYEKVINLKLDYKYSENIQKSITVLNVN